MLFSKKKILLSDLQRDCVIGVSEPVIQTWNTSSYRFNIVNDTYMPLLTVRSFVVCLSFKSGLKQSCMCHLKSSGMQSPFSLE